VTTRLNLYNDVLLECKERKIASLSVSEPTRRYLDEVWDNGWVDDCLGEGQWLFAKRSVRLDPETSVTPLFGRQYAYAKPTDHIRTMEFCSDEYFKAPLLQVDVAGSYWFADIGPLYCSYVSNDPSYGNDLSKWPADFTAFARFYGAWRVHPKLTGSKVDRAELKKNLKEAKLQAQSSDSMEQPTRFMPAGTWTSARTAGRNGGAWDRGSRRSLYGY
jgi:hypothetical protein